ncbi:hypothetical protein K523DRAFT_301437 [Schizophyllum commune Tattone D]|nr:hypothetical protein K523DRAFT_301437 [Schizophyllum commune Tattone D]
MKKEEHSCCGAVEEAAYKARERSEARRSKPQPWIVLKLTVFFTLGIMGYTAYVYIHRFVVPMIKGTNAALGSFGAGVALIIAFALLWLWMVAAYFRVIITSPGKAKDYVPETPEPPPLYPPAPSPGANTNINLPPNAYFPPSAEPKEEPTERIGGPSYEQQQQQQQQNGTARLPRLSTTTDPARLSVPASSQTARDSTAPHEETKKMSMVSDTTPMPSPTIPLSLPSPTEPSSMASPTLPPASAPLPGFPRSKREAKEMERALHIARRPPPIPFLREEQRYCTRCRIVKPYRAHHCRACGTCVLRYDHHCPWIGQCVGAQNYKFFFNFCEATWVFTTYTFATLVSFVATHGDVDIDPQIIVIIALSALFMCFTAAMVIAHTRQIMMGQTTVELMYIRGMKERENAMMARVFGLWEVGAKGRTRDRWDAEWGSLDREGNLWWQGSAWKEWTSVMGTSWIGWIFPIGRGGEDGLHYEPNPRFDPEGRWPFLSFLRWHETWPWPLDEGLVGPLVDTSCKLISSGGAGYDFLDVDYLTRHGVYYANTAVSAAVRTADSTAALILQVMRAGSEHEMNVREGKFLDRSLRAKDVRRSTLGIIGMGNIGKLVRDHMQHFGMKVIYSNRRRLPPEEEKSAAFVSFDEILNRSDVLSINCPLTKETRHLLDKEAFAKMRDGIIVVNTSRGPVIDEQALVDALESGKVLRAALDVYENEPEVHPGLIKSRTTTLSPHCAVYNETIFEDQQTEIMANLEAFIKTGKPNTPINEPVFSEAE